MKQIVIISVLFCVVGIPYSVAGTEGLPDGADLFIEAIRCRVGNHTLVHSLFYVTEQAYRMPTLSEEEIEKKAEEEVAFVRKSLGPLEKKPNELYWNDIVDRIPATVRERYMQSSVLSRFTVKYKAPGFSRKLLSVQIERQGQEPTKWEVNTSVIEANVVSEKSASEGAVWHPQGRSVHVGETQFSMEPFLNFGRLQGPPVSFMLLILLQDTDVEKYEFSEKNIAKLKEGREKQIQAGQAKTLQTVGTATYDGDAKAYIVQSSVGDRVTERYWIDIARGYICPLIQYYDEKGRLLSEYKANGYFLHEQSGLWFPQVYEEMTTERDGKQQFKEYRIDKLSVNINFPITDDEFAIEIPEGAQVVDERQSKESQRYVAIKDGVLSLGKDGLDLKKQTWLWSAELQRPPMKQLSK